MELDLGLGLSSSSSSSSSASSSSSSQFNFNINESLKKRKHADDEEEDDHHVPQTLSLLVWNNNNKNQLYDVDHEDDVDADTDSEVQSNIFVHHRNDGGVIGWPPVRSCRKKLCNTIISDEGGGGGQGECEGSKSMYVKVHMEGIGIARKVDLNLHNSYLTLVHTLANMFGKCYEEVKLTYQDQDGDWSLAGDVPWGSFIKTIQRLKLLRNYKINS